VLNRVHVLRPTVATAPRIVIEAVIVPLDRTGWNSLAKLALLTAATWNAWNAKFKTI